MDPIAKEILQQRHPLPIAVEDLLPQFAVGSDSPLDVPFRLLIRLHQTGIATEEILRLRLYRLDARRADDGIYCLLRELRLSPRAVVPRRLVHLHEDPIHSSLPLLEQLRHHAHRPCAVARLDQVDDAILIDEALTAAVIEEGLPDVGVIPQRPVRLPDQPAHLRRVPGDAVTPQLIGEVGTGKVVVPGDQLVSNRLDALVETLRIDIGHSGNRILYIICVDSRNQMSSRLLKCTAFSPQAPLQGVARRGDAFEP